MGKPQAPAGYQAHAAIALICEEHRFLRGQCETLHADLEADVELAAIAGHAKRFMAITAEHFLHEEWAMRVSYFPDLAIHEVNHRRFISDANDIICKLPSSAWRRREGMALAEIYWHWMDHHQAYDRRFSEYSHELLDARELIFDPTQEFGLESPKAIGERRFAAVLCADVAGFARLVGENEAETIAEWCSCWHEIVKPAVIAHDGRIVKSTGDGFIAEFALPRDAVFCALAIQTAVSQRTSTASLGRRLMLRMGIHACHIVPCGTDIFGHGVNIAARLQAEASPGTICISESARRTIGSPEELGFIDLGFRRLRHIDEPLHVYVIEPRDQPNNPSRP
jgi:class 3 adenylate cyclase